MEGEGALKGLGFRVQGFRAVRVLGLPGLGLWRLGF